MTRLLIICAITFVAATAAAEPVVHTQPTFPLRIMQIHAAGTGAYLMASKNEIWFVEGTGVARQVPIPLEGQIQSLAFEPHSGLLWGCTRESVFATDAAGAWQSWGLGDASTRQRCYVAPSPGTTWVFGNAADEQGSYVEFGMVGGAELTLSLDRIRGAHLDKLASDQAGGVWATVQYPQPGLIHFDGGSWRVSSTDPQQWLGTEFTDVFGLDRAIYAEILASNGVGGLAAVSTAEFVFVRSTAPYAAIDRVAVTTPGFDLAGGSLAVGGGRVWGLGHTKDDYVLASWDFSGTLVSAESVPIPTSLRGANRYERRVLSADAESTWVAIGGVLLRRAPSGWSIWVAKSTVDRLKDERRRNRAPVLATLPWIGAGATLAVVAPKFWSDALAVPYPRALGETLLGWTVGTFGHWPIIQNGPWDGFGRGAVLLTFGLLLNTGIATVATITPELFFTDKGDPFPVGGAVLGAATGYVGGAILDLVLDRLGIESEFGRAALWSSFTAVGAPLGFHLMRGPRGAD